MKKNYFLLLILVGYYASAQEITILDKESHFPVSNVSVINENNSYRVVSDANGNVDLSEFSAMEILTFSHVSYVEREIIKKQILGSDLIVFLQDKSEILNEVFLSATKSAESRTRIAEQVAVFSSKDIELSHPQTSADMLGNIPGIKVQKSQFGGGSPVLRGMESNRVLLVVDGVRMNNAIYRKGHLQNSLTVSPNLLEKTEVIFGPSSVVYGSDALGGVIHYYTRKPKTSLQKEVDVDLMSRYSTVNDEFTASGGLELQFEKWGSFTAFSYSNFNDLKMGENRSHDYDDWGKQYFYSRNTEELYYPEPTVNADPEKQKNIGFDQLDVIQKFYFPISQKTDLYFNFQYSTSSDIPRFDRLTEMSNGQLKFAEWRYGPQNRFLASTQLKIKPELKFLNEGTITLAYQDIEESRINRKFGSLDRSSRFENVDVFSLNGDFSVPLKKEINRNLGYGFELAYNEVNSNSKGEILDVEGNKVVGVSDNYVVQTRYPDGGSDYLSSAVYIAYRQDLNKKSTLNTGIRLTNTNLNAKWIDTTYVKLPDQDIHVKNTALTVTLGYAYKPTENWQINSVISSGFRAPNIDDIAKIREKGGMVTVPNIDLNPEFAYNAELGIIKYFNNKNYLLSLTGYYTLLDNYIYREAFVLNGESTIIYDGEELEMVANVNKGTAYIAGGTFLFKANFLKWFSAKASLTVTQGTTYDTNVPMSSIPPTFGGLEFIYSKKNLETGMRLVFNGRKKIEDYNIEEGIDNVQQTPKNPITGYYTGNPSWETLNFFAKYKINNNLDFMLSADNVFDQHYKEFASAISAPGRNFSFTLMAGF